MKLHSYSENRWSFYCPGCKCEHTVSVNPQKTNVGGAWGWNGSTESPTFTPSILVLTNPAQRCHSYVTDGQIRFLPDCFHALKGQTVPLPEWEEL